MAVRDTHGNLIDPTKCSTEELNRMLTVSISTAEALAGFISEIIAELLFRDAIPSDVPDDVA